MSRVQLPSRPFFKRDKLEFKAKSNTELIMIKEGVEYSFNVQINSYGTQERLKQAYEKLRQENK